MGKIVSSAQLKKIISPKIKRQTVVLFCGTFDLFHYGHLLAFKRVRTLGDVLIVKVNGNKLAARRKGRGRPFLDERERVLTVSFLEFVDYVFISNIHSEDIRILKLVKPDIFVRPIQSEETDEDRTRREKALLKKLPSMRIVWLEQTPGISSTKISEMVRETKQFLQ